MRKIRSRRYHSGRRGTGGPTYAVDDAENTRPTRSTRYLVRLVILLKNDEVIDFLTWPPTDFSALKMTAAMFASERADFSRPQPALCSVADPIQSTRWQIFTVLSAQPLSGYAAIIAFAPKHCSCNVWILSGNDTSTMINVFAEDNLKAVATFMPRRNNMTLAIFTLMVTYFMRVYILKMAVSPLCIGVVFISFTELEMRLVCCS